MLRGHIQINDHVMSYVIPRYWNIKNELNKNKITEFYRKYKYCGVDCNNQNCSKCDNRNVLCLNIENFYETIDHNFIGFVMRQISVPEYVYTYFDAFYSKANVRIFFDGRYTKYFKMSRGLLRNDNFSCIIINICLMYIVNMIGKFDCTFTLTTDDITVYSNDLKKMKKLLFEFLKINKKMKTGCDINFEKSFVMISDNDKKLTNWCNIKILEKNSAVDYFGMYNNSFSDYNIKNKKSIVDEIIDEFRYADGHIDSKNVSLNQSIYDYLISRVESRVGRIIMYHNDYDELNIELNNYIKYFVDKWRVNHVRTDNFKCCILDIKTVMNGLENLNDFEFRHNVNSCVGRLYEKYNIPIHGVV